jgi:hypothetical protein
MPTRMTTEAPAENEVNRALFLEGAHTPSFGQKHKLCDMQDVSVCLCGQLARPILGAMDPAKGDTKVVCCKITGCKTKWVSDSNSDACIRSNHTLKYHLACVGFLLRINGAGLVRFA